MQYHEWPVTAIKVETEPNPHSHMSEYEPTELTYRLSVPPLLAERAIPRLGEAANRALGPAEETLSQLVRVTSDNGIHVDALLAGLLIRLEAVSSSQIEDLDGDLETELVRDHDGIDMAEETELALVSHNVGVVASAVMATSRVTPAWLLELHRKLMTGSDLLSRHIGEFRDVPVWIGPTRATASFEGAPHEEIDGLVEDLCRFAGRFDVHPIVQAAIAHAQFETIHPFADGNGRLGRALIHPIMRRAAPTAIVPTSHALLAARSTYFEGLGHYREGDLDTWIETFANAVNVAARAAIVVTEGLAALSLQWQEQVRTHRDGTTRAILEQLPSDPVVTIASARSLLNVSQPAAHQAIGSLVDAGVLRRTSVSTPGKAHVWVAGGVLEVLGAIERVIGPR